MRKVRINRAKWRSGDCSHGGNSAYQSGYGDTALINDEGFRCCLGFAACQLGKISLKSILNLSTPEELPRVITPLSERTEYGVRDTRFTTTCIEINDDQDITQKQRESKLKRKFKTKNIQLEFYGEYGVWVN